MCACVLCLFASLIYVSFFTMRPKATQCRHVLIRYDQEGTKEKESLGHASGDRFQVIRYRLGTTANSQAGLGAGAGFPGLLDCAPGTHWGNCE